MKITVNEDKSSPPDLYVRFNGTFGEFADRYFDGCKFYALSYEHPIEFGDELTMQQLKGIFNNGIYVMKEPEWYCNLSNGVACWVWNENEGKAVMVVVSYHQDSDKPFKTNRGTFYKYAQPLTKDEAMNLVWGMK